MTLNQYKQYLSNFYPRYTFYFEDNSFVNTSGMNLALAKQSAKNYNPISRIVKIISRKPMTFRKFKNKIKNL